MKTEAIRQAFTRSLRTFCPDAVRASYDLHCEAVVVEHRAQVIWGAWWWKRGADATEEATVHQATDLLLRLSAILELESARAALAQESWIGSES